MAKEKNYNPVQAQRKADKAKAIKKGKADVAAKRNERLAKRNPIHIQKQIDDLKAITTGGGKLSHHEEQVLEGLEKELKAVQKARETLGDAAPQFRSGGPRRDGDNDRGALGKRRRGFDDVESSSDSDVPEDVRAIPMPRDTPPPIPKEVMDKWWAKRRAKRNTNANMEPLGGDKDTGGRGERQRSTPVPVAETKTVYEAKPMVRDLRKEAVAFVPTVVRQKLDKTQGKGGLMEPEEADKLEKEGYLKSSVEAHGAELTDTNFDATHPSRQALMEEVEDDED
ncbi:Protein saf1 [Cytospora mali]|uniref:Protein saf1 n=1 Tax=Cytospora mali TaxID=578113 RepID=A0A194V0Z6_CYTMA|nr:Protein saf1 [Valsa mali var. pyri (nom. inval.)]